MGRVSFSVDVPGRISDAERLWFDTSRWPAFVQGLHHVARQDDGWPAQAGSRVVWDSVPDGRGRVVEVVEEHVPRSHHRAWVEDGEMRGTQTVRFEALQDQVRVTLELRYEIKRERGWTPVVDFVFVRRPVRDQLRSTLARFAREVRADRELVP